MQQAIKKILKFQKQRNWKKFHLPKNLAISLAIESAEVLELFQWNLNHNFPKAKKNQLSDELADVYYYLLLLCHVCNIDLKRAFNKKMIKNEQKYPVDKAKGNSK